MADVSAPPGGPEESAYPLSVVEQTVAEQGWEYVRDEENLEIEWKGAFVPYMVKFCWLKDIEVLSIACAFNLKVPTTRTKEVSTLIEEVNSKSWAGHFDRWNEADTIMFRYGLILAGGSEMTSDQCRSMLELATSFCDRFYPGFYYIVWGGKSAHEALQIVEFETEGEA